MTLYTKQLRHKCIALASIAFALLLEATGPAPHTPAPTPMPSAHDCYYFKRLYPATVESFDRHHLSAAQRRFIVKYVKKIPAAERRFAKWTFDADVDEGLLIYDAFPVRPDDAVGSRSMDGHKYQRRFRSHRVSSDHHSERYARAGSGRE